MTFAYVLESLHKYQLTIVFIVFQILCIYEIIALRVPNLIFARVAGVVSMSVEMASHDIFDFVHVYWGLL